MTRKDVNKQNKSQKSKTHLPQIAPIISVAIVFLIVGTLFYSFAENLTPLDAFYFCVMTLTTIGYSSVEITTVSGKVFTIFYALFGVGIIASAANYIIQNALAKHALHKQERENLR